MSENTSETSASGATSAADDRSPERISRPTSLRLLASVVGFQTVVVAFIAALLGYETVVHTPTSMVSSIALTALVAVGALFGVLLCRGVLRARPWIRGASLVWNVLLIAASVVVLQGDVSPMMGWLTLVLSVVGIVAALHPATRRVIAEVAEAEHAQYLGHGADAF